MFRAVVEHGGFSQAAQQVHKSQSSIHHAVQKLEASLGVSLLEVTGRKPHLTEVGTLMLRRANYLLEEAAKLEAVADALQAGTETCLRIAVEEIFPQGLLYEVLDSASGEFPLLNIEIYESVLGGAQELLEKGEVDLAIVPFSAAEGFTEQLCQVEFVCVANPSHALHQTDDTITLETLKSHRQIVVRDSASVRQDAGWLQARQRWTVSHLRTSVDMVASGLGFAWLPVGLCVDALQAGTLKPLPLLQGGRRQVPLYLLFEDGDKLGPAARSFIGHLRKACMDMPCLD